VRPLATTTLLLALAALALVVAPAAAAASGPTTLRIVFRATPASPPRVATLRCNPPRGTAPRPTSACRRLRSAGRALFAPTPPGTACTQIYGGPQVALVTGTLSGRRVWARFARRDGCETERWNRIAFLLPAG
jgi:hypothetical protein